MIYLLVHCVGVNSPLIQSLRHLTRPLPSCHLVYWKVNGIFTRYNVIYNALIPHFFTTLHLEFHFSTFSNNFGTRIRYALYHFIVNTQSKTFGSILRVGFLIFSLQSLQWLELLKLSTRSGGPYCVDLSGMHFILCFRLAMASILRASSVLDLYDTMEPSSAAMCFKQATLSTLYTFIIASLRHWGVSLLHSLFRRSTAFVLLGHCFQISASIEENAFDSILKWSHLAHHCAQCIADDQSHLSSINFASFLLHILGISLCSSVTGRTPQRDSKHAVMLTEFSICWTWEQIFVNILFSLLLSRDDITLSATCWHDRCQCTLHPSSNFSANLYPAVCLSPLVSASD